MKKYILFYLSAIMILLSLPAFSQNNKDKQKDANDTTSLLGLPGDNLDLYAVLDLFQKSKTIEAFEKSLNEEKNGVNNLDLNLDKKIDFIKVTTKKDGNSYMFILQVDVTKTETQDVAVILLDKDKNGKVSLQCVGDEDLYGKDYVIEPKGNSSVTANPGYVGSDPVKQNVEASATTNVTIQQQPIVQYVYSPAYVPYAPPYYYGYYPPWFGFATVMAVGIYRSNHYYHGGYYGGHYGGGNTVVINNNNQINHYNNSRNRSTTVSDNRAKGNYGTGTANRGNGASASTRLANGQSNRGGTRPTTSDRKAPSTSNRQTPSASTRQSSNFSSGRSAGGGGRSMGGGGARGGGGRRR